MKVYNPKEWFSILFQIHKSDTLRELFPLICILCSYAAAVAYLLLHFFSPEDHPFLKNVFQLHTLLSFALSLLLVFRTNTAYDRWWEGRRQWGALVNCSRNLAIKLQSILPPTDTANRDFFKRIISLYAEVLKKHLKSENTRLSLDENMFPELKNIDKSRHIPNQVACLINDRVILLNKKGIITGDQLIYLTSELTAFTDICGACERIKNTPIPYSYSSFIKKFIFIYVITLPISYVHNLGYWIIPMTGIVFYVLASLELVAEEIEDPFGTDFNDLPMEKMVAGINKHVAEILR